MKSAKKYGITRLSACVTLDPRAPTRMRFRLWVLTHFRITVKTCDSNLRNYIFFPNTEAQLTLNRNNWIRGSKMPRPARFGLIKFYFIWCVIVYKGKNRCTASIHSMKDCNCPAKCQPPVRSRLLVWHKRKHKQFHFAAFSLTLRPEWKSSKVIASFCNYR